MSDVDDQLLRLATALDPALRRRLIALVQADSRADRVLALEERADRADALAAECRLQLRARDRQVDRVRSHLERTADAAVIVEDLRVELRVRVGRPEFAAHPPTPPPPPRPAPLPDPVIPSS